MLLVCRLNSANTTIMKSKTVILTTFLGIFLATTAFTAQQADTIYHNGSILSMAGCALALDLLERIQELEAQLAHLRR